MFTQSLQISVAGGVAAKGVPLKDVADCCQGALMGVAGLRARVAPAFFSPADNRNANTLIAPFRRPLRAASFKVLDPSDPCSRFV